MSIRHNIQTWYWSRNQETRTRLPSPPLPFPALHSPPFPCAPLLSPLLPSPPLLIWPNTFAYNWFSFIVFDVCRAWGARTPLRRSSCWPVLSPDPHPTAHMTPIIITSTSSTTTTTMTMSTTPTKPTPPEAAPTPFPAPTRMPPHCWKTLKLQKQESVPPPRRQPPFFQGTALYHRSPPPHPVTLLPMLVLLQPLPQLDLLQERRKKRLSTKR